MSPEGAKWAWCFVDSHKIMVPRITGASTLYVFFHEVGHAVLDHEHRKQLRSVEEYEATQYAFGLLRVYGVVVSRGLVQEAKAYVKTYIGPRTPDYVKRWAKV